MRTGVGKQIGAGLRAEAAWIGRGLRARGLWAGLGAALLLWVLAWQVKTPYALDVGGITDDAFVQHFNAKEPDPLKQLHPPFTYRWSQAASHLTWPGLGNVPLTLTLRLAGPPFPDLPPPVVTATVRGQSFPLALTRDLQDYSLGVGRGTPLWDGDLVVTLQAPPFQAPGDPRELGVLVDRATVTPAGPGPRPGVVPPVADLARWALAVALAWLLGWRLSGRPHRAGVVGGLLALAVAAAAAGERPNLGLLAPLAPPLLLAAYILAVLTIPLAQALLDRAAGQGTRVARRAARDAESGIRNPESGSKSRGITQPSTHTTSLIQNSKLKTPNSVSSLIAGALAAAFLVRVGGMLYPQFLSSDILLHVKYLGWVADGTWLWAGVLPNGAPQPYPPLPYLAPALLAGLVPDHAALLRVTIGLLDATCVLPVAYLAARLGGPRAGAGAAGVYAFLAAPFGLLSAGVYAYLFASVLWTWTLALWGAVLLAPRVTRGLWTALAAALFLTFLGAYGILIAAVSVVGIFIVGALIGGPADLRRRAVGLAAALALAGAAAFVVYYIHFVDILLTPAGGVDTGVQRPADPGAALLDLLSRRLEPNLGLPALVLAVAGWLSRAGQGRGLGLLVLATAAAGLGFAAISLVAGENIRYALLFAPPVAVGAGLFLGALAGRGRAGGVWSMLLVAALLWHLLGIWLPLIFTRYH